MKLIVYELYKYVYKKMRNLKKTIFSKQNKNKLNIQKRKILLKSKKWRN